MKPVHTIEDLIGISMSDVTFVMDYLQLGFHGATINAYSNPIAETPAGTLRFPAPGLRDALCSFIGHVVEKVTVDKGQRIVLTFDNGQIEIPLDAASRRYEAVEFFSHYGAPPWDY